MDNAYRLDEEDRQAYLPKIPVQPIGYTDAEQILNKMAGDDAPDGWQGGLNITYKIGGSLIEELKDGKITVEVNNMQMEKVNQIGMLCLEITEMLGDLEQLILPQERHR